LSEHDVSASDDERSSDARSAPSDARSTSFGARPRSSDERDMARLEQKKGRCADVALFGMAVSCIIEPDVSFGLREGGVGREVTLVPGDLKMCLGHAPARGVAWQLQGVHSAPRSVCSLSREIKVLLQGFVSAKSAYYCDDQAPDSRSLLATRSDSRPRRFSDVNVLFLSGCEV